MTEFRWGFEGLPLWVLKALLLVVLGTVGPTLVVILLFLRDWVKKIGVFRTERNPGCLIFLVLLLVVELLLGTFSIISLSRSIW